MVSGKHPLAIFLYRAIEDWAKLRTLEKAQSKRSVLVGMYFAFLYLVVKGLGWCRSIISLSLVNRSNLTPDLLG